MGRARHLGRTTLRGFEQLTTGLGTGLLALLLTPVLLLGGLLSLLGLGRVLAPPALRGLHGLADLERGRLDRWTGPVPPPPERPERLRAALRDGPTRRELGWVLLHATVGVALALVGLLLPVSALRDLSFPAWWWLADPGETGATLDLWTVYTWWGAFAVSVLGLGWVLLSVTVSPLLGALQTGLGRALLAGEANATSVRIAELTATRAAALDAHAAELRRIERSLHDGTQNRLVAATILLGAARRSLGRDPQAAASQLEQAQTAAEEALAQLRVVARGILPPVLDDHGLEGALRGLAGTCPVPCRLLVDVPGRCAASVEATAYFLVAEALTNVARHAAATEVAVTARRAGDRLRLLVVDDGRGGAAQDAGTGLVGIRRRVAAHDGSFALSSPDGGPTTLEVTLPCGS